MDLAAEVDGPDALIGNFDETPQIMLGRCELNSLSGKRRSAWVTEQGVFVNSGPAVLSNIGWSRRTTQQ